MIGCTAFLLSVAEFDFLSQLNHHNIGAIAVSNNMQPETIICNACLVSDKFVQTFFQSSINKLKMAMHLLRKGSKISNQLYLYIAVKIQNIPTFCSNNATCYTGIKKYQGNIPFSRSKLFKNFQEMYYGLWRSESINIVLTSIGHNNVFKELNCQLYY